MESIENINKIQEILSMAEERWKKAGRALKRKEIDHAGGFATLFRTHALDRFSPGKGTFEVIMLAAFINIHKEQVKQDLQAITQKNRAQETRQR